MSFLFPGKIAGEWFPEKHKFNRPEKLINITKIRIIDVRSIEELKKYEHDWKKLLLQSTAASPMLSYPWISAYFETKVIMQKKEWRCLFAYEKENLIGVLPLITDKKIIFPCWSVIFFKTPHDIFHTSAVDCLTLQGREDIIELFFDYLNRSPHTFPVIRIKKVPKHSPSMIYINQFPKKICIFCQKSGSENFIPVSGKYENYINGLSSKFKKDLKRQLRRFKELGNINFSILENKRSVKENVKRLLKVEGSGWKGRNKTSIEIRKGDADFHFLSARRLHRYGWIEWYFLEVGEKTIAVYSASRINGTIYALKTGFDEKFSRYSPGKILFHRMIKYAFESDDVNEINCMSDMAWQKKWNPNKRLLYNLIIFPQVPILSKLLLFILRLRQVLKKNKHIANILKF